jgi:hypothetical protein
MTSRWGYEAIMVMISSSYTLSLLKRDDDGLDQGRKGGRDGREGGDRWCWVP